MESFYPEEVTVSWLQNDTVLPEPLTTEQNPDGTYRTRRYYTLSPEQREQSGKVECVVKQPGVVHPVTGLGYLEKLDPQGKIWIWNLKILEIFDVSHKTRYSTFLSAAQTVLFVLMLMLCHCHLLHPLPLFPTDEPPVLNKSAKASVAMMCISLVLVFLLCFGFSWRRRDGESYPPLQIRQLFSFLAF